MEQKRPDFAAPHAGLQRSGKRKSKEICPNEVVKNLRYDEESGKLFWKVRTSHRVKVGDEVKSRSSRGYIRVSINGNRYFAHRVIWAIFYGDAPDFQIDHINGDIQDNRICNLRKATHSQNNWNQKLQKKNTSGIKGVSWDKERSKWTARCTKFGKVHCVGRFDDIHEAEAAIVEYRKHLHGEFHRDE